MELEPHRLDLLPLWADGLEVKDLTAAEPQELRRTVWRSRAIADDPPPTKTAISSAREGVRATIRALEERLRP